MSDGDLEWATAPLLDPRNVGKAVWISHNGNRPYMTTITKIGRTNITVDHSSLRVQPDGQTARSPESVQFPAYVRTEAQRLSDEVRAELLAKVNRANWGGASTETLARVVALLEGDAP